MAEAPTSRSSRLRRAELVLTVAGLVTALDQLAKTWAEHHLATRTIDLVWTFRLHLELNPGLAFGLGRGSTGLVTVAALGILVVVAVTAWRTTGTTLAIALGLIMGGAAGNLVDRLVRDHGGRVIDFVDPQWWPVFNVADAAVSCGVVLAFAVGMVTGRPSAADSPAPAEPPPWS
jgi:signal peptidase II